MTNKQITEQEYQDLLLKNAQEYQRACELQRENNKLKDKLSITSEICPYCDNEVELPPYLGIYKCPKCGELIISCSMCEKYICDKCAYFKATETLQKLKEVENEQK